MCNSNTAADITDEKLIDRIGKFADVINTKNVYRVLFRYICDIGKINFPLKIKFKIR